MKKLSLISLLLFLALVSSLSLKAQDYPVPVAPTVGEPLPGWEHGTTNQIFSISSIENLLWIAAPDSLVPSPTRLERLGFFYYQTCDINATATRHWYPDGSGGYKGFIPIGGADKGIKYYDGRGYGVNNLYINRPDMDYVGLFGMDDGYQYDIMNLGMSNVDITGRDYVGGLIGYSPSAYIMRSFSTGSVSGRDHVGGLVGKVESSVYDCYSTASVVGSTNVGGLVGILEDGLNQFIDCLIRRSYAAGSVNGTGSHVGGLIGFSTANVYNSFWDTQTSGQSTSSGGSGKATCQMKSKETFTDAGWDFTPTDGDWLILESDNKISYPYLQGFYYYYNPPEDLPVNSIPGSDIMYTIGEGTSGNPYQISDWIQLNHVRSENEAFFVLINDLDANSSGYDIFASSTANEGAGWLPVGDATSKFTGNFNGNGYTIDGLYINRTSQQHVGLFGYINASGSISNLGLTNITISGKDFVGGLAGTAFPADVTNVYASGNVSGAGDFVGGLVGGLLGGTITNSHSSGAVSGSNDYVGGLVGQKLSGSISNSYSTANVSGISYVGGLAGSNIGDITKTYSKGSVNGTSNVGGLLGGNLVAISDSFWDIETSGQATSAGGVGKSTAEMKNESTFTTWDFTFIWDIISGTNDGYPNLDHQYEYIWDGSISEDWNTSGNWNVESVPALLDHVKIPADAVHDLIISSSVSASCNNLTIENGASLTIESNATRTGSLIINGTLSNNGTITTQRYFPGATLLNWHMVSAPVANMGIAASGFAPITGDFYAWDEPTPGTWVNYKQTTGELTFSGVNGGDDFVPTKGYLLAFDESSPIHNFNGRLNTGNQTFTLKNSTEKDWSYVKGWNLMGNPYTSAIDWHKADKSLFLDDFAYAYNPQANEGAGAYVPIDGSNENAYIAANQGFFVIADASTANNSVFTFTNAIQTHGGTYFKNTEENDKVVLRLASEFYYDETTIRQHDESTYNKDRVDAFKMNSFNADAPNIYSISDDNINLAINSIPQVSTEYNIRIGMLAPKTGLYKINVVEASNYMINNNIYLEDLLLSKWHKISESEYSFTTDAGDIYDRFVIHFGVVGVEETIIVNDLVQLWTYNSTINLYNPDNIAGELRVYNIMGQVVKQTKFNTNTNQQINLLVPDGYYIVNIVSSKQIINKKVFLR